jgi:hypothetical protein
LKDLAQNQIRETQPVAAKLLVEPYGLQVGFASVKVDPDG